MDQLYTSFVPAPSSITIETLMTCNNGGSQNWLLNGTVIKTIPDSVNNHCTCSAPINTTSVTDTTLIGSLWDTNGNNNITLSRTSTGANLAWSRVIVDGSTTCIFDFNGGDCTQTNLCNAGHTTNVINQTASLGVSSDGEIDVAVLAGQSVATAYDFNIQLNNPDAETFLVTDTVPSDWVVNEVGGVPVSGGSSGGPQPDGNGGTLEVTPVPGGTLINWRPAPGKGGNIEVGLTSAPLGGGKFVPNSCGTLIVNQGAQAFILDTNGNAVLPPALSSNELCLAAVVDEDGDGLIFRNGQGDEDADGVSDIDQACTLHVSPCNSDTTPPIITAPGPVTAEATGTQTTVAIGNATATDDVSIPANITITSDAPATYPLGTTVVTWTATDEAGNSASAPLNITVVDTTAPALTVPADVTVEATGPATTVALGTPTTTDLVGVVSLTNDAPPGGFPVDETILVTWKACDAAGNCSTDTQNVTVRPFPMDLDVEKAEVHLHKGKKDDDDGDDNKDKLEIKGHYSLFENGDGIDPANEVVIVTFDGFSQTIPAGSFVLKEEDDDGDDDGPKWVFHPEGKPSGIHKIEIRADGEFSLKVEREDFSGVDFSNPVPFSLRIGNDFGATDIPFDNKKRHVKKFKSKKHDDND